MEHSGGMRYPSVKQVTYVFATVVLVWFSGSSKEVLQHTEQRTDGAYCVKIYALVPRLLDDLRYQSKWDYPTVIHVFNREGSQVAKFQGGNLGTCDVLWGAKSVCVGTGLWEYPEQ